MRLRCLSISISTLFWLYSLMGFAQAGSVMSSYGVNGYASISSLSSLHEFKEMALQPNGKSVAVGYVSNFDNDGLVARFNADGSLDQQFGTGGFVELDIYEGDAFWGVHIQSDGRILACGWASDNMSTTTEFLIVRLNSDGTLDQSFGINGSTRVDCGGIDRSYGIATDSNGNIYVSGNRVLGFVADKCVVKLSPGGTLDSSFALNGVFIDDQTTDEAYFGLTVDPNDRILVAGFHKGSVGAKGVVTRILNTGVVDASFNSTGSLAYVLDAGQDNYLSKVQLDAFQNVVACGYAARPIGNTDALVLRIDDSGVLDNSFGMNGAVTMDFNSGNEQAWGMTFQSSGSIVVCGGHIGSLGDGLAVWRLQHDGSLDLTFGGSMNGIAFFSPTVGPEYGFSCVVDADDDILVTGFIDPSSAVDTEGYVLKLDGDISTGIQKHARELVLYPNPFVDHVQIELREAPGFIQAVDARGRTIQVDASFSNSFLTVRFPQNIENGHFFLVVDGIAHQVERIR